MGKDTKLASGTTRGGGPKVMGETMKIRRFDRVSTFCGIFVLALVISLGSAQAQTATEERVKVLEEQLNSMLQQLQDIPLESPRIAATRLGKTDLHLTHHPAGPAQNPRHGKTNPRRFSADGHRAKLTLDLTP